MRERERERERETLHKTHGNGLWGPKVKEIVVRFLFGLEQWNKV